MAAAGDAQKDQLETSRGADDGSKRQRCLRRRQLCEQQRRNGCDHHHIEQHRREGGQADAAVGVQHGCHHRDRTREGEIRQHQPQRVDGELKCRLSGKRRRQWGDHVWSGESEDDRSNEHGQADRAQRATGECGSCGFARVAADPGIGRHQHRVQRAFAQKPARDIDELERKQERVRDEARAEQRRDQGVAQEA